MALMVFIANQPKEKGMDKFSGIDYIRIDIANQYGLDKELWETRIEWTKMHEPILESLMNDAEEPMLFIKGVYALRDAIAQIPTGFIMGLDATASGTQIMSLMTGCVTGMRNTNVIDCGKRADFYQIVTDEMSNILEEPMDYERKEVKGATMKHFYGSKEAPKEVFIEGSIHFKAFYKSLYTVAPGASEMMKGLLALWRPYTKEHVWSLPDGFVAKVKVMQAVNKKIEINELKTAKGGNATFTHRMYENVGKKKGLSIAANSVHSVDGYVVREMGRKAKEQGFDMLAIHDSFHNQSAFVQ